MHHLLKEDEIRLYAYQCEFHVAFVAPPVAPRVADDPVVAWDIDTNNVYGVVDVVFACAASEDTALVWTPVSGVDNN